MQNAFGIGLCVIPWSTAAGITYSVQHTFDGIDFANDSRPVAISRAGTVATVTDLGPKGLGHGLSTGDSLIIRGSGSTNLDTLVYSPGPGDASVDITVTSNTQYTYPVANTGPAADGGYARALTNRVFPHAVLVAQTARADGNYAFNIRACRLKLTAYTGGAVDFLVLQGTNT
jgi:hypothetical protein